MFRYKKKEYVSIGKDVERQIDWVRRRKTLREER